MSVCLSIYSGTLNDATLARETNVQYLGSMSSSELENEFEFDMRKELRTNVLTILMLM